VLVSFDYVLLLILCIFALFSNLSVFLTFRLFFININLHISLFIYVGSTTIAALLCQRSVVAVERDPKQFQEICKRVVKLGNILNDPNQLVFNDDKSFPASTEPFGEKYNFQQQVGDHAVLHRGFRLAAFRQMNGYSIVNPEVESTARLEKNVRPAPAVVQDKTLSSSSSSSSSSTFFVPLLQGQEQHVFSDLDYVGPFSEWKPLEFAKQKAEWCTLHGSQRHGGFKLDDSEESFVYSTLPDVDMKSSDFDDITPSEPVRHLLLCSY
jgi:hypothetical protein